MGGAPQATLTPIAWAPFSQPQQALVQCPLDEIFFGGARGGGKTDAMLGKFSLKQKKYGAATVGVFFRKTREDLKEAIERSKEIYGPMGAIYTDQKKQWVFPSGARLKFEYLERDSDAENYQGHSYTDLFFEELTNWKTPTPINKLRATLRSSSGVPCQFHATGNPGGPGHQWVKARYIDPCPTGYEIISEEWENPFTHEKVRQSRVFIPSKLSDNPTLMADPGYVARLYQSGSRELVRAWLYGDWDIVEGAFFDCWGPEHVIRPFEVPKDWLRFRSCDWGSAKPFSVGWWAVVPDWFETVCGAHLPRGAIIRYREWYGCERDPISNIVKPDTGLKLTAGKVGEGILERDAGEKIAYSVIDPAAFSQDGGPSIVENMKGINWRKADNKRVGTRGALGGWDMMRARMVGEDFGEPYGERPMMYVFSTCTDFIRTVPVLQHDENRPEDLDTASEDHAADEARYACMSRPYIPKENIVKFNPQIVIGGKSTMTINDLIGAVKRRGAFRD